MGWIKALAIGIAVIVVFSMVSVLMHLAYLIIVAVAIGAIVAVVLKANGDESALVFSPQTKPLQLSVSGGLGIP